MNAIKTKYNKLGSFFSKAWVFAAARKESFPGTPIGLFMCRVSCGNPFFKEFLWRILKKMLLSLLPSPKWNQKDAKKLRKNRSHIKFFIWISVPITFLFHCSVELCWEFPCGGNQSRRVSWWSIPVHRQSCQGWMRTIIDLWPDPRSGQPEKLIGMKYTAFASVQTLPLSESG